MTRVNCPACGADVDWARIEGEVTFDGSPKRVPLDTFTDASSDAPRYRVIGHNPMRVERVAAGVRGDYFPDHRHDCPGANAGR